MPSSARALLMGCEFANNLVQSGYQVHVADPSSRPLVALLPEAASTTLANALHVLGLHWHFVQSEVSASSNSDAWVFVDAQGWQRGFALAGKQTASRMALAKRTVN